MRTKTPLNLDAVQLTVAEDRMSVLLYIDPVMAPSGVDVAAVVEAAESRGIVIRDDVLQRLGQRVSTRAPVMVSKGIAPVDAVPATLVVTGTLVDLPAAGPVTNVALGDAIAQVVGGVEGQDGRDVHGRRIPCVQGAEHYRLGPGTTLTRDNGRVVAAMEGRLVYGPIGRGVGDREPGTGPAAVPVLRVLPLVELAGDLGIDAAMSELGGDLRVRGAIKESVTLAISGSLAVAGAVEGKRIDVGEDLIVGGGLLGREKGLFTAGRDVRVRFATAALIEAGRDVLVSADLLHCKVIATGKVRVDERIQGSQVLATGGIHCKSVSNSNRSETVLDAGTDPALKQLAENVLPGVEGQLQRLEHGKMSVDPLLRRKDLLTPAQKQQALRMVQDNARLEREITEHTSQLRERWERVKRESACEIQVDDVLGAGVVVRFPGMEAVIPSAMRGPLTIRPDRSEGEPRILIVDRRTGSATPVGARGVGDNTMAQLHRVMGRMAA